MGGKGSGGARIGAGRKPKKIERRGRKKGEVRIGAGRQKGSGLIGTEKRITISASVDVGTVDSLADIQREENVSRGIAIDRAVRHYTEHKGR